MFATKSLLALFAIATGGFISVGNSPPQMASATPSSVNWRWSPVGESPVAPSCAILQDAAEQQLLAQIRNDLRDSEAQIKLSALHFERTSNSSLEGRGDGIIVFDAGGSIPIDVVVTYDPLDAGMARATYLVAGPIKNLKDESIGQALKDNIGSRMVLEFAQQPVDFSLGQITHLASGRNRLMISGNGVTSFPGEGAAYTRFVATADRASGRVLSISYELLQQIETPNEGQLSRN
jgi:hypothetical protein